MKTSDQIDLLALALAKAQGEIGKAKQSQEAVVPMKTGGQYKYGYATLADVWDTCRKPLSDNGLAVIQSAETTEEGVEVTTLLAHSSGQWVSSSLVFSLDGGTPQAIGSAITYGRRYGLAAIVGITPAEDDDGQAAEKMSTRKPREVNPINPAEQEHWCEEHQTLFFKRGKMHQFAHPIEGQPGQWHNEEPPSESPQTNAQGQQVGLKPKVDYSLMEPRYTELAEMIRSYKPTGPAPAGGTWDSPATQSQIANLAGHFGDEVGAVVNAIWGLGSAPNAGQAAAIFAHLGKDPKDTVAKLLRLMEEEPPEELFPEVIE